LEKPIDPEYVKYEITTVRSEELHFIGRFCSAKTVFQKVTMHIDNTESQSSEMVPTATKLGICPKMIGIETPGTHHCLERKEMIRAGNKWTYHDGVPQKKKYLHTTGSATRNCL
jgi:hypothetical protein